MPELLSLADLAATAGVEPAAVDGAPAPDTATGVTLFPCGGCGKRRPAFALYDTREDARFTVDWSCEDDVWLVLRAEIAAAEPAPEPLPKVMSVLQYLDLFEDAELATILASTDAEVVVLNAKTTSAQYIDFGDPRVAGGLSLLVAKGLLTQARADAILATGTP